MPITIECCYETHINPNPWCDDNCPIRKEAVHRANSHLPLPLVNGSISEEVIILEARQIIAERNRGTSKIEPESQIQRQGPWELGDAHPPGK